MSNLKIKQMVRSSFSTLFFIRENRVRKDGTTIIEVLITVNGERCGFSTGKKVKATSYLIWVRDLPMKPVQYFVG